jgi:hypothetical protein
VVMPPGQSANGEMGGRGIQTGDMIAISRYPPPMGGNQDVMGMVEGVVTAVLGQNVVFKTGDSMSRECRYRVDKMANKVHV